MMYEGKIMRKTIQLTDRDYEVLKKKWHPDNVKASKSSEHGTYSVVKGECSLCTHHPCCNGCPLNALKKPTDIHGCISVLNHIFDGQFIKMLNYWENNFGIIFHGNIPVNKKRMEKVQAVLNTFKRVNHE